MPLPSAAAARQRGRLRKQLPAMTEIVVTENEAGHSVTAAVGDQVKVVLPESPTTGFRWQYGIN